MNSDVEAHEFPELLVLEADLVSVVGTVVESSVTIGDGHVITVLVGKDDGCNA